MRIAMQEATFPFPGQLDPEALHRWMERLMQGRAANHYVYAAEEAVTGVLAVTVRAERLPAPLLSAARSVPDWPQGAVADFTLIATAEKKAGRGPRKPLPSTDLEGRTAWLAQRGRLQGFEIVEASARVLAPLKIRKRDGTAGFALDRTRFTGRLRVSDPGRFADALRNGIGRGRAYGNGFLFIHPS